MHFFFLPHNFKDKRFILTGNLGNLGAQIFFSLIKSRTFTLSLEGRTLW
jgi:hypothetical protein